MKSKKIFMTVLCGICFAMTACGTENATSTSSVSAAVPSTSSSEEKVVEDVSTEAVEAVSAACTVSASEEVVPEDLNDKIEGENVFRVFLTNKTGSTITGIAVKKASDNGGESEYSDNLITSEDVFSDQQQRTLYFDTTPYLTETDAGSSASSSEKMTYPDYDMQITWEDGTTREIPSFPFAQAEEFSLCLRDNTAYAEYVNTMDGSIINTLTDE